jgi:predicted DNA-binding mobile mystery protein A
MYQLTREQRKLFAHREALDRVLQPLLAMEIPRPRVGWVKAIRTALGMRVEQLARRAELDPTTVTRLEQNEAKGSITLGSLEHLADALDCTLVYALVPKKSLDAIVRDRAETVFEREQRETATTMALEAQQGSPENSLRNDILKAMLVTKLDKRLWEED